MFGGKDIESLDEKEIKDLKILYSELASGKRTWDSILPKSEVITPDTEIEALAKAQEDNDLPNL
jgi:hypothetical protein